MNRNTEILDRITEDLRRTWAEMAPFMVRKRVRDVGASPEMITDEELLLVITLLERKTLASSLGPGEAKRCANRYRRWVRPPDMS